MTAESLIEKIETILPQTQCRQCGFTGCTAYAQAIVNEGAAFNRCAPGGQRRIDQIAQVLGKPTRALDPEYGHEMPFALAKIIAERCIGCHWCQKICPTDAIVGAPKHLYAVIEDRCTGCALCLLACPMDCIEMIETDLIWDDEHARKARNLYEKTLQRRALAKEKELAALADRRSTSISEEAIRQESKRKKSLIADLMKQARKA